MESIKLTARARTGSGKSYTRKARVDGWVPAAYYGFGIDAVTIEVDAYEFGQILSKHKQNMLIELNGEGIPADATAVIREVQRDAIKRDVVFHVDFQHADEKRPVKTRAFLKLVGVSEGEQLGGILTQTAHEIDIMGPINSIPEILEVDISVLKEPGNALMASAIKLDDDITLLTSENRVVARILGKAK